MGGGALIAVGGVFMGIGAAQSTDAVKHHTPFGNAWFDLGFAFVVVGLVLCATALYLHFRKPKPEAPTQPQRVGIDSTGGSIKGQIRIRQQDRGIVSRDTDISGDDIDIE